MPPATPPAPPARRCCRRATPATLTGVRGRPTRASAFSTDSERPRCSEQSKESSAAHANVEAAIATVVRLICCMAFLRYLLAPHFENDVPSLVVRQGLHERHDM